MSEKLESLSIETHNAKLQRIPLNTETLPVDEAKQIVNLIEAFEDDDDVQDVFHNLEMTDELEAALEED